MINLKIEEFLESNKVKSTQSGILAFEKLIKRNLPEDYKDFILRTNGGLLEPTLVFQMRKGEKLVRGSVEDLFGLEEHSENSLQHYYHLYHTEDRRMMKAMIAIGSDAGGNKVCIDLSVKGYGRIYFWDHDWEVEFDENWVSDEDPYLNCYLVADSFTAFANKVSIPVELKR